MTRDEYTQLFHREQLNLVAFKRLMDCDHEVLRLVNAAIAAEREACARVCDALAAHPEYASEITKLAAHAIRARSKA
jgi:hypothetical protein